MNNIRRKRYVVMIQRYNQEPTGTYTRVSAHRSKHAALRSLGSVIGGRKHRIRDLCKAHVRDRAMCQNYTWKELRNLIESGAL